MKAIRNIILICMGIIGFMMRWSLVVLGIIVAAALLLDVSTPVGSRYWLAVGLLVVFYAAGAVMELVAHHLLRHLSDKEAP